LVARPKQAASHNLPLKCIERQPEAKSRLYGAINMNTRTLQQPKQPNGENTISQAHEVKTRLLTAKHLRNFGITYCVSRESNPMVYEMDNPALDLLLVDGETRELVIRPRWLISC
jgi:hypothetical protein